MANGHPQFGGTGGVPVLDLGQPGGTRHGASDAFATVHAIPGADEVATSKTELPQQNVTYEDVGGLRFGRWRWEVTLRTKDNATFVAIVRELNALRHGSLRDASTGVLLAPDPSKISSTRLTDHDGTILSEGAVLANWVARRRRSRSSEWAVLTVLTVLFELLE